MLTLDITNATQAAVGNTHGLDWDALCQQEAPNIEKAVNDLWANKNKEGAWSKWLTLAEHPTLIQEINTYADSVKGQFEHLVIVGIGGSALGAIAMFEALLPAYWNNRSTEQRGGFPQYYVVDNVDPDKLTGLLDVLDLSKTLVNVVTKSGTTAESMAGFLLLKERLTQAVGAENVKKHLVFTTDPQKGLLRQIANEEGVATFEVPDDVGGRFSIFSAVGLLPAVLVGIPIAQLFEGIQAITPSLQSTNLQENIAAQGALVQYAMYQQGKPISVFMPYSAKLAFVADWYVQLWAESLGKKQDVEGTVVNTGPTPIKAVGVTDQHSQVQLFNEGPFDKITTFVRVGQFNHELTIPNGYPEEPGLNYLGGKTFSQLLQAEGDATRASLTTNQRPNVTLTLPQLDAPHFAQLLFVLEVQTALMGALLNVDPFDQPGVELGKQYTYALMGRPGFEDLANTLNAGKAPQAVS